MAIVGELPNQGGEGMRILQAFSDPNSREAEPFRTLRTSLALSSNESSRVAFTSAEPGDGKTTTIANLATVYAQSGKKTLFVFQGNALK